MQIILLACDYARKKKEKRKSVSNLNPSGEDYEEKPIAKNIGLSDLKLIMNDQFVPPKSLFKSPVQLNGKDDFAFFILGASQLLISL